MGTEELELRPVAKTSEQGKWIGKYTVNKPATGWENMWLRDSGAQVWPYVQLANSDPELKKMLSGVIRRQFKCINIDSYANAFNDGAIPDGHWMTDLTEMKSELHGAKVRKYV